MKYPVTPDGRYFVVKGRLWRCTDPSLHEAERRKLVAELMSARRSLQAAGDDAPRRAAARDRINAAKVALGERGAAWWDDGAPDYNRKLATNTPYRQWFEALPADA